MARNDLCQRIKQEVTDILAATDLEADLAAEIAASEEKK